MSADSRSSEVRSRSRAKDRVRSSRDAGVFWEKEKDPDAKRRFLSLIFKGVWLDADHVVAVQPRARFDSDAWEEDLARTTPAGQQAAE